jgi:magnesium-transporting ATPase (P-type)
MNPKLVPWLQRIFWTLGWSVLVLAIASIVSEALYYFYPPSEVSLFGEKLNIGPEHHFSFLEQMRILFSSIGQAFFAFLVSAIFDMIFHRAPVGSQRTERFLVLTCVGFVGEGLLGLVLWGQVGIQIVPQFEMSTSLGLISVFNYLLSLFPNLISFVYAITIYVLYKHFSQMVAFESEVV